MIDITPPWRSSAPPSVALEFVTNCGYSLDDRSIVVEVVTACGNDSDPKQRQLELSRNLPESSADPIAADDSPPA
ncbi:hypothetical protein BDS110ZK19_71860 [Bradyrhizobium diazoefficiens]